MGVSFYLLSAFLGCLIMLLLCVSEQKMDSDCEVKGTSAVYGKLGNGEDHGENEPGPEVHGEGVRELGVEFAGCGVGVGG